MFFSMLVVCIALKFEKILKPCDYHCEHGSCSYKSCNPSPNCPGGACYYFESVSPTCTGSYMNIPLLKIINVYDV